MVFENGDYEQDNTERELLIQMNKARLRVNLLIDAEAGVDGNASNDEVFDDENDELDGFIVADDIEF